MKKASELKGRSYTDTIPKKQKIVRLFWNIVWTFLFKPTPRWCLNGWRVFLLRCFGAQIGEGTRILPTCFVWAPWNLTIGEFSVLAEGVECYSMDKINIGNRVSVSQRSFICTGSHDINSIKLPLITQPINISDFTWVCAEVYIGPGVNIGEGSIIAARSVVCSNIDDWSVVAGHPAKFIKNRTVK